MTTQDGQRLSLKELRGKVVAVTFIYASCTDTCPLLTAKMAGLQAALGADFGPKVFFLSITVDPERDTPAVLQRYAQGHGANFAGWAFLSLFERLSWVVLVACIIPLVDIVSVWKGPTHTITTHHFEVYTAVAIAFTSPVDRSTR